MSLLFRVVFHTACQSTHHRLALDALRHLRGADSERWNDLFLHHFRGYLSGSKAPDDQFKDFRNHVLHVSENNWGGAIPEASRWYGRTVDALRRREWSEAVYSAGVLSHYFSDPFMPLHTGQTEAETQVHRALEWSVSKSYGELQQIIEFELGGYPRIESSSSADWLGQMILAGAQLAHEHYQPVIDHYDLARGVKNPQAGMDGECKHRIAECLAHAVVGFARVLEKAISESDIEPPQVENTLYGFLVALEAPLRVVLSHFHDLTERMTIEAIYDEVQRTGKVIKNLPEDDRDIRRLHAEEVLRTPLHRLDQQPAPLAGMLFGQGQEDRQHPNRLVMAPVVGEDLSRPLALVARRQGTGDRGQRTGDRGQRTEDRGQGTEDRG
ncbi:MAG TPA: zinc dependent phospholipase C family protein, partial [Pirellulaceae bacterium]|nr:zinc dependent phospholipase C family protein [Pirellulaceae bacterium]